MRSRRNYRSLTNPRKSILQLRPIVVEVRETASVTAYLPQRRRISNMSSSGKLCIALCKADYISGYRTQLTEDESDELRHLGGVNLGVCAWV